MYDMEKQRAATRAFFDHDSASYRAQRYQAKNCEALSYVMRKRLVLEMLEGLSGRLLDIGCGPGVFSRELIALGFDVVSLDLSYAMLRQASGEFATSASKSAASLSQGDVCSLPFKADSFDAAICIGVLSYLIKPEEALSELVRVLRKGGTAIVQTTNSLCMAANLEAWVKPIYWNLIALPKRSRVKGGHLLSPRMAPWQVRRLVWHAGFRVDEEAFYDFRLPFVEKLLPQLAYAVARSAQRLERSAFSKYLGEGQLLKLAKV